VRSEILAILAALTLSGCSLTRTDVQECELDSECREAFGIASLCTADGYCEILEEQERCRATYPGDFEENPGSYPNIVLIGTIIDEGNEVHRARARAVEVAIQDANDQGGLGGRDFGLVVCDNGDRPTVDSLGRDGASVAVATWLRDVAEVAFIVGPPSSGSTQAVFENVDDVLLISPSASSDRLTLLDGDSPSDDMPGTLWRTAVPDGQQAPQIAADMASRGITDLAVVFASGAYGESLAELVIRELGDSVSVEEFPFATAGELGALVTTVGGRSVQEVLFISSNTDEAVSFINTARTQAGYADKTFFLTDAAANSAFTAGVTDATALARVRGTRPVQLATPEFETFVSLYQIRFGTTDVRELSFTSNAFDAAWLGLYGMAWAVENEPDMSPRSIAAGLRQVTGGSAMVATTTPSSWLTVQNEFEATPPAAIEVVGASGDLDYDPATEELSGNFEVWVVVDGDIVTAP
jgi:ABC-type branched-subunit amino acid transport system substrate-binding protein